MTLLKQKYFGVVANILIAVYLFFFVDDLLAAGEDILAGGTNPTLGVLLGLALLVEFLVLKKRGIKGDLTVLFFFLWMGHTVATTVLTVLMSMAIGQNAVLVSAVLINMLKELSLLAQLTSKETSIGTWREELQLFFFLLLSHTLVWKLLTQNLSLAGSTSAETILNGFVASLLFLLLALPLRLGFIVEEVKTLKTKKDWTFWGFSIFLLVLSNIL